MRSVLDDVLNHAGALLVKADVVPVGRVTELVDDGFIVEVNAVCVV
jgi:hypothetical protein